MATEQDHPAGQRAPGTGLGPRLDVPELGDHLRGVGVLVEAQGERLDPVASQAFQGFPAGRGDVLEPATALLQRLPGLFFGELLGLLPGLLLGRLRHPIRCSGRR